MAAPRIGVVGLGLIGGSFAKAAKAAGACAVYGADTDARTLSAASASGAIDGVLDGSSLASVDLLVLALYPRQCVEWLRAHAAVLSKTAIVMDCGGVKGAVCAAGEALASEYGFTFIGAHPMAGTERSGFAASRADLFHGASILLVPGAASEQPLATLEEFLYTLGFGSVVRTDAETHDAVIAYTSQLAHVVSSAYIQSPVADRTAGFTGGSFHDMTRVAYLNEQMWTQLFVDNRENLCREISGLIERLEQYLAAIAQPDPDRLCAMLRAGRIRKTETEREGLGQ